MKNKIVAVNKSLSLSAKEIQSALNHRTDPDFYLSVYYDDLQHLVIEPKDEHSCSEEYTVYDIDDYGFVVPKTFADILEEKGISGNRLSIETGIPQSTIQSWTSGVRNILKAEWMTVLVVCKHLGYTAEEFLKKLT